MCNHIKQFFKGDFMIEVMAHINQSTDWGQIIISVISI